MEYTVRFQVMQRIPTTYSFKLTHFEQNTTALFSLDVLCYIFQSNIEASYNFSPTSEGQGLEFPYTELLKTATTETEGLIMNQLIQLFSTTYKTSKFSNIFVILI